MADVPGLGARNSEGVVAHDAPAAGNPVIGGGVAQDMDDTAPPNQVSTEGDATRLACDADGTLYTHPFPPRIWDVESEFTTQQTDTVLKAAPGAGLSLHITDIYIAADAGNVDIILEEGTTTLKFKYYSGGQGDGVNVNFRVPKKFAANTSLTISTSAAVTVFVSVNGFTGKG